MLIGGGLESWNDGASKQAIVEFVGRVTDDFPGEAPHRFSGGTIDRVAIDVSGDAYLDLEREAELMLMRE